MVSYHYLDHSITMFLSQGQCGQVSWLYFVPFHFQRFRPSVRVCRNHRQPRTSLLGSAYIFIFCLSLPDAMKCSLHIGLILRGQPPYHGATQNLRNALGSHFSATNCFHLLLIWVSRIKESVKKTSSLSFLTRKVVYN